MTDPRPLAVNRYRNLRGCDLRDSNIGETVHLAGWIAAKRDHGGLLFLDLRDGAGVVQLVSNPRDEAWETTSHRRVQTVIAVTAHVAARPPDKVNEKLPSGTVEVVVDQAEVLSKADVLPFPVERD